MKVADSYIDESVEVQLQVDAFKKANKLLKEQKTKIVHKTYFMKSHGTNQC